MRSVLLHVSTDKLSFNRLNQYARQIFVCAALAALMCLPNDALAAGSVAGPVSESLFFRVEESQVRERGEMRLDWNYDFLRDSRSVRVFNSDQTITGTRSLHRKTHLVAIKVEYGVSERLQAESDVLYEAFRQEIYTDGDEKGRHDDGDIRRFFSGISYQAIEESESLPDLRLRGGVIFPFRAETEGIGEELGFEVLASVGKQFGETRLVGSVGFSTTFGNHDHPTDATFSVTPISKAHELRTLTYGIGLARSLNDGWQANVELDGRAFDIIELNRRSSESELSLTVGVLKTFSFERYNSWLGFGVPIGLTHDTDHLGVLVRTGIRF